MTSESDPELATVLEKSSEEELQVPLAASVSFTPSHVLDQDLCAQCLTAKLLSDKLYSWQDVAATVSWYVLGRSSFSVQQRQLLVVTTVQQLPADLTPRERTLRLSLHGV